MPSQVVIDVTARCKEIVRQSRTQLGGSLEFIGHVHRSHHAVHSTSRHRPMDLRANDQEAHASETRKLQGGNTFLAHTSDQDLLLMVEAQDCWCS